MATKFKVGDDVRWNYEGGTTTGKIIKIHTENFRFKGYMRHCSEEEPQYEIESHKTGSTAVHKGSALKKI